MLHDPKREISFQARQVLLNAAQYLEEHGWCQGALEHDGRVCLFGALKAVSVHTDTAVDCAVVERLRRVIGRRYRTITVWNDCASRSKAQVVAALRKAALR